MQLIEAVPLALAQATVSDVNRLGASPGRILVLSGLFLSLRISLKSIKKFSTDVLQKPKSQAHFLDAKLLPLHKTFCTRNLNFHLFN